MSGRKVSEPVEVPAKGGKPKEEEEADKDKTKDVEDIKTPKKDDDEPELSAEDRVLKEKLDLLVSKILGTDKKEANESLEKMKEEIRDSTSSMTSVPKPLKFLQSHYDSIKTFYSNITDPSAKIHYGDLMSILAMTMEDPQNRECLKYRLESDLNQIQPWGAQYVKHLAAETRIEMDSRLAAEDDIDKLADCIPMDQIMAVVEVIVQFYMKHNSEPDACDILLEVEKLDLIKSFCEEHNHARVCEYLRSCAAYHPYPEDIEIYRICFDLYFQFKSFYNAMRFALRLDDAESVNKVMSAVSTDKTMQRQLAYLLGWHQYGYKDEDEDEDEEMDDGKDDDESEAEEEEDDEMPEIDEIISNTQLSEAFHNLARDLDVLDPKDPETDVFKEQLVSDAPQQVISAKKSLGVTYANAFVNAGYGTDKFMTAGSQTANEWLAKNKERGQMASVASIGSIMLWDENAVNTVDRYFVSEQKDIRAGAYLAIGLSCSGMRSEAGLGHALLSDPAQGQGKRDSFGKVNPPSILERVSAAFGLGMAYAGQANEEVYNVLAPLVSTDEPETLSSISALALGLIYVGSCNSEISNLILTDLMERESKTLDNSLYLFNALGLGLVFLQRSEDVETTLEATAVFEEINPKFAKTLKTTLEVLAYAGTGNVLKIQQFLSIVGEHFDEEDQKEKDDKEAAAAGGAAPAASGAAAAATGIPGMPGAAAAAGADDDDEEKKEVEDFRFFQSIGVLGIALCAMGEDLGTDMALRMFDHLIQYGNARVKRAVPLGLALLFVSNPRLEVSDVLSKLSHDNDVACSQNAILSLGLIAAGTNNARIATMLRNLTVYYAKEPNHLYLVRIAQGLVHMGKGLLTVQPYHSDRFLLSKVALCGILTTIIAAIDIKNTLLSDKHYLLYGLVMAMKPRMLVTLDEKLKPLKTSVRVGQALDVVAQAGRPKSITGFQTHETPVLLGYLDRAELATDEYVSVTPILEGFAIFKPNKQPSKKKKSAQKDKK